MFYFRAIFPIIGCIFFYSCSSPRYIYTPSAPNNPYFNGKGQSKLAASYSGGMSRGSSIAALKPQNRGFDIQAAYSINKNWAITAGYFNRKERDIYPMFTSNFFDSSIVTYQRHITDLGGGYYFPIDSRKNLYINLFGGIGFGKFALKDRGTDKSGFFYNRYHNSQVTKWFLQTSLNTFAGNYFRASFIGKFSFIHYGSIATSYSNEELQYFYLDKIRNKTIFYFEPAFNMQVGFRGLDWLKLEGCLHFSTDPFDEVARVEARSINASIGLCVDLTKLRTR